MPVQNEIVKMAKRYSIKNYESRPKSEIVSALASKCKRLNVADISNVLSLQYTKNELCQFLQKGDTGEDEHEEETDDEDNDGSLQSYAIDKNKSMFLEDRIQEKKDFDDNMKRHHATEIKFMTKGADGKLFKMKVGRSQQIEFARKVMKYSTSIRNVNRMFLGRRPFNDPDVIDVAASMLVSQAVLQNICPNFTLTFDFGIKEKHVHQDMELINGEKLREWLVKRTEKNNKRKDTPRLHFNQEWNSVIFQIIVALWCMQRQFGMIHHDLHVGNIMITTLEEKDVVLHYKVSGNHFYVPTFGYFVQIIDFGRVYTPKNKIKLVETFDKRVKYGDHKESDSRIFLFDSHHLLDCIKSYAPAATKEWSIQALNMAYEKRISLDNILILYFTRDASLSKCQASAPCFDLKPKHAKLTTMFDIDKKMNLKDLPKELHQFVAK